MRKLLYIFSALALSLALVSCAEELVEKTGLPESDAGHGKATFTFTPCFDDSVAGPATKAFGDKSVDGLGVSTIQNIYFAVFDANGYKLSEYAAAVPNTYAVDNSPATYSYSVELTVTDQPRIVHIIANAPDRIPYGSEAEVIGSLVKNFNAEDWDGEDAYWARIYLEDGVWAQPDPEEAGFAGYQERLDKYIAVRDQLSTAKLLRNFTKIQLVNGAQTNFKALRFWLTNVPAVGSIAPYNRNTGTFQTDYTAYTTIDALRGTGAGQGNYQGFMPVTAGLCSLSGKTTAWLDAHANEIDETDGGFAYCYERESPRSNPLYIIIGGKFDSDSDGSFDDETETYYKVDLRDSENQYFPILRNFIYRVNVHSVRSNGASSVEAALSAAPSGDISTSIGLENLTNISNGVSQIIVSETSRVLVGSSEGTDSFSFQFKYIPNMSADSNSDGFADVCNNVLSTEEEIAAAIENKDSYVTIEFETGSTGYVFDHAGTPWEIAGSDDENDFRTMTFYPLPASAIVKTEEITIQGHYWNPNAGSAGEWESLTRTITYRLREKLLMTLELSPSKVAAERGEQIDLVIGIEAGLPSSVFSLEMKIEAAKLSLTSNDNNLPVSVGPSQIPGSTEKSAFSFSRAITWDEYSQAPVVTVDGQGYKYFTCHFKTNTANIPGAADNVWVFNNYFNSDYVGFTTYAPKTFSNVTLSPSTNVVIGDEVRLGFNMSTMPSDNKVLVGLYGFEPSSSETSLTYVGSDSDGYEIYSYNASSTSVSGLRLVPFLPGTCRVKLNADEFRTANASITAERPVGGAIVWADVNGTDSGAIDWVQPQNYKVYNNNLIVGQTATLTVYVSVATGSITIGDLATTRGASIQRDGVTLYAYSTAAGAYSSSTMGNKPLIVKYSTEVIGGYTVPVYGISRGTALTSTTHSAYNSNGTGWYIFVNTAYTGYHLRSNGTNLVGVSTADDYNSLLGFSATSASSTKVLVPSNNANVDGSYNVTLTMSTNGSNYTVQYQNGGIRMKSSNYNRYWNQSSNTSSVQITNNSQVFYVYPVTFVAP